MNKNNNCRQDRSEGCPGDMPGGRSPENPGSDRMNKNNNCRQDRSKGCPAALSAGVTHSYPCALYVMSGTDVVLNLSWVCAYRVTTLLSLVEAVAWL